MPDEKPSAKIPIVGIPWSDIPPVARGMIAVIAATAAVGIWILHEAKPTVLEVVAQRAGAKALQAEVAAYARHLGETPNPLVMLKDDPDDQLTVGLFADRVIVLRSVVNGKVETKLVVGLGHDSDHDGRLAEAGGSFLVTPVAAAGRCIASHPDVPAIRYGRQDGCLVEAFLTYRDGCVLRQVVDGCDHTIKGAAWVNCVH